MAALIPGKLLYLRSPHTASVATERAITLASPDALVIVPGHCTMEEILRGQAHSKESAVLASVLRIGDETIVTTVRNPYDVIVTWWLRATRGEGSFVAFIREFDQKPQINDGEIFTHIKHCDVVMRYEDLDQDFSGLMDILGLPRTVIPVDNMTPGKEPWQTYYDDEALEAVNLRFGVEIEGVGYPLARSSAIE